MSRGDAEAREGGADDGDAGQRRLALSRGGGDRARRACATPRRPALSRGKGRTERLSYRRFQCRAAVFKKIGISLSKEAYPRFPGINYPEFSRNPCKHGAKNIFRRRESASDEEPRAAQSVVHLTAVRQPVGKVHNAQTFVVAFRLSRPCKKKARIGVLDLDKRRDLAVERLLV